MRKMSVVCATALAVFMAINAFAAAQVYVAEKGSNDNNGLSQSAPFATLEKAYESVDEGGKIFVCPGVVMVGNDEKIALEKAVTIEGVTTREECIIARDYETADSHVLTVSNDLAVVKNVTITGGHITSERVSFSLVPLGIDLWQGKIDSCIVSNNVLGIINSDIGILNKGYTGGIVIRTGSAATIVTNCFVVGNRSDVGYRNSGGGIWADGECLIVDCVITNNTAYSKAGGVGLNHVKAVLRDSLISFNKICGTVMHDLYAGGVVVLNGLVEHCEITDNAIPSFISSQGGGLSMSGGAVINCLIARNCSKNEGGGVYQTGGLLMNCTIADNVSQNSKGGGLYIGGGNAIAVNNIIYGNDENEYGMANLNYSSAKLLANNCFFPETGQIDENNVIADPLFIDLKNKNYGLQGASSCIDAGILIDDLTNTYSYINKDYKKYFTLAQLDKDLAGNERIKQGNIGSDAASPDMGCFEAPSYTEGDFTLSLSIEKHSAQQDLERANPNLNENKVSIALTPSVTGIPSLEAITYTWAITNENNVAYFTGESSAAQNKGIIKVPFSVGQYDVYCSAYNKESGETRSIVNKNAIFICAPWAYVVPEGTEGNVPTAPYHTWETAANSITVAMKALTPNEGEIKSSVIVADGNYQLTDGHIFVDQPIDIVSVNGPEATVLKAFNPDYRPEEAEDSSHNKTIEKNGVQIQNENAIFAGFSITEAKTTALSTKGIAAALHLDGGVVSNCWIYGNLSHSDGKGVVYVASGEVHDSRIFNNRSRISGAGTSAALVNLKGDDILVCGCEIISNESGDFRTPVRADGSLVITNCVIANNIKIANNRDGYMSAGGLSLLNKATLVHCIITNNVNENLKDYSFAGGICVEEDGGALIRQCLIAGNISRNGDWGQGIYLANADATVENCTIADNGTDNGYGIYSTAAATIKNTIISGHTTGDLGGTTLPRISHSCYREATEENANGNISKDPKFKKGYTLASSSPCINMGENLDWMNIATTLDLGGNLRILNKIVDMGCYERNKTAGTMLIIR